MYYSSQLNYFDFEQFKSIHRFIYVYLVNIYILKLTLIIIIMIKAYIEKYIKSIFELRVYAGALIRARKHFWACSLAEDATGNLALYLEW